MGLFAKGQDVPQASAKMQVLGGALSTQQVVGKDCSLMVARRSGGYHSKPHVHNCEQLNYVLKGEMWIFVEKQAFHLQAGDFLRVPAMAVHWAWNRTEEECELLECHAPALDILPRDQAMVLLGQDEDPRDVEWVKNIFVSTEYLEVEKMFVE